MTNTSPYLPVYDFGGNHPGAPPLVAGNEGPFFVCGDFANGSGAAATHRGIAKIRKDGSVDPKFNPGYGVEYGKYATALLRQPSGKILVGGNYSEFDGVERTCLTRLGAGGEMDTTFTPLIEKLNTDRLDWEAPAPPNNPPNGHGKVKNNNGHGNNVDGVDISNPGKGGGGPNGKTDTSAPIDDEKKFGITIEAYNTGEGPDFAILFDTHEYGTADPDLEDNPYQGGNLGNQRLDLGNILIVAENGWDYDQNGLVDDPDDELNGGMISFTPPNDDIIGFQMTIIDVEQPDGYHIIFEQGELSAVVNFFEFLDSGSPYYDPTVVLGDNYANELPVVSAESLGMTHFDKITVVMGGTGGIDRIGFYRQLNAGQAAVWASEYQDNGKILIGGNFDHVDKNPRMNVARLNADGTLDTSFHPGDGPNGPIYAIAIQGDDKIIVAGAFTEFNGAPPRHRPAPKAPACWTRRSPPRSLRAGTRSAGSDRCRTAGCWSPGTSPPRPPASPCSVPTAAPTRASTPAPGRTSSTARRSCRTGRS
ncbi:MAG: hypothetical protein R3F11_07715 [Verrucomicrobiales bacterium]